MLCMTEAGIDLSTRQTAAGLPTKGSGPNASAYAKIQKRFLTGVLACAGVRLQRFHGKRKTVTLSVPGTEGCGLPFRP